MIRSIAAVIAGFVLWSALWLGYNALLTHLAVIPTRLDKPFDDSGVLAVMLLGSMLFSLAAGYVTAWIARSAANGPVIALGLLLVVVGIFVQLGYWHLLPLWYHLSFLVLLLPLCVLGARLRQR